ncbi:histidine kinase [Marivirga salinae]|uniref:Histidine kinase n=1 Tax=Marivirga salinarum TaxID=3059078 RepID=A0AA51N9H9_9BACT|nr:histidine kinase [Marivirga sp. BDSF4-3]WMN11194.1 histidine kinase [Marivirga sp. BDSF4-3]
MKIQHHITISKKNLNHFIFWCVMLIYYISSSWPHESDKVFLFERMFSKTIIQLMLAYLLIYLHTSLFVVKKRRLTFVLFSLLTIYIAYVFYTAIRCYYLVPKYPEIYQYRPPLEFIERITNGYAFIGNITELIFPAIILIVIDYYRKQQELISLKEQKKTTELHLLKHQLNPHFLFNTLNNLYSLSIQKSDRTPEAIAKLSDILDYMLYKCNDNFVSLKGEIALISNYIELEKIRYGKRLDLSFDHSQKDEVKVAPLLLLTFVENAFKHGVTQELNVAKINILVEGNKDNILFKIENSKPVLKSVEENRLQDAIGLQNIRRQLELLYPKQYHLEVVNKQKSFLITLKITPNDL